MDHSTDGDEAAAEASIGAMLKRWNDLGLTIAGRSPQVFRAMVVAGEATAAALSTATEPTQH